MSAYRGGSRRPRPQPRFRPERAGGIRPDPAEAERPATPTVTVMSDYGFVWPLTVDGGAVMTDDFADEHDLGPALRRDLLALQKLFDDEFHHDSGWRTPAAQERYARQAVAAQAALARELGPGLRVEVDLWPVTDPVVLRRIRSST